MHIVHGDEFLESECGGRCFTVVNVEALSVAAPIAVCVRSVSFAYLHPPLRTPAVVAEEISEPIGRRGGGLDGSVVEKGGRMVGLGR